MARSAVLDDGKGVGLRSAGFLGGGLALGVVATGAVEVVSVVAQQVNEEYETQTLYDLTALQNSMTSSANPEPASE